jgi:hypothetical protein
MTSRREFMEATAPSALAGFLPAGAVERIRTSLVAQPAPRGIVNVLRAPDGVCVASGDGAPVAPWSPTLMRLTLASPAQLLGEPLDWQRNVYPARWRMGGREVRYDWTGADGAGLS